MYGNFHIELPSDDFEMTTSDEELLNMDSQEIEACAEATASSIVSLINMPDLNQSAIEELPKPETPVMSSPTSKETKLCEDIKPSKRFKSSTDEELENLFKSRQAESTKSNTKWAMKMFQDWNIEVRGSKMDMENVGAEELSIALSKFYVETRPKATATNNDCEVYHRNTLKSIRSGINRHLADLHRNIDITRDKEFKTSNGVLDGLLKERTRNGESKPTKHKAVIEKEDLQKISAYLSGAPSCPIILRHHVWYNLSIHFVSRGMEFHHQLKTNSFSFQKDDSGEYVTLSVETQQKNHQGGLNSDYTLSDKRMYATGTPSCPVKMLKLLLEKTDENATHLFNQYRKSAVSAPFTTEIWFTDKPLAKRTFANFLADICKAASIEKNKSYTPHCLRATAIQFLNDEGFEARHIMFMSSHKNESSLRSYNRTVSTSQKKKLSKSLSAISLPESEQCQSPLSIPHSATVSRSPLAVTYPRPTVSRSPLTAYNDEENSALVATNESPVTTSQNNSSTINVQTNLATPNFFANAAFTSCTFHFNRS